MRSWCNWRASCVAAKQQTKQKNIPGILLCDPKPRIFEVKIPENLWDSTREGINHYQTSKDSCSAGLWHQCLLYMGTYGVPRGRRLTFASIDSNLSGFCFVCLISVDNVKSSRTFAVSGLARRPAAPRCDTLTPFALILLGRIHDIVYLTFVVPEYVSCWGTDRQPQVCTPLYLVSVRLAFQTRQLHC